MVCSTPYSYGEVQENRRRIFLNRFKEPRLNTASPDVVELAKALVKEMDSRHASSPGLVTPSPFLYIKPRMILNNQIRNI